MKTYLTILLSCIFVALCVFACKRDDDGTAPSNVLTPAIPQGWPSPVYTGTITQPGFDLGRKLFYDPIMSRDNTISCSACHQQFAAFSHYGHPLSHGIDGLYGTRNAPGLFNLIWNPSFMWDGGINHLELQPLAPLASPVEMDQDLTELIAELSADATYRQMFNSAYGTEEVTSQRILQSLAQFMAMMVSSNSKYDQVMRGDAGVSFTASEQMGLELFRANCTTCHPEPLFTDFSYRNNGLPFDENLQDSGRYKITHDLNDVRKFKVPSLRNCFITGAYFHDGRAGDLFPVFDHYISGIEQSSTLDPVLQNGIPLTLNDKYALWAFLKTLTDNQYVNNPAYSFPGF